MTQNDSILPPNSTPLQKDLEAAAIARLFLLRTEPLRWLNNPEKCLPEILPWLAWAMSVDVWNDNWALEIKQSVIRQSIQVHKQKGTIGALRRALSAFLFASIRIEEWFKYGGTPFTFRVYALFSDEGHSTDETNLIYTTLMQTKNLRSHLDLFLPEIETTSDRPKIAAAFGHLEMTTIYPREDDE
jgi:phage tail P2-like protein